MFPHGQFQANNAALLMAERKKGVYLALWSCFLTYKENAVEQSTPSHSLSFFTINVHLIPPAARSCFRMQAKWHIRSLWSSYLGQVFGQWLRCQLRHNVWHQNAQVLWLVLAADFSFLPMLILASNRDGARHQILAVHMGTWIDFLALCTSQLQPMKSLLEIN